MSRGSYGTPHQASNATGPTQHDLEPRVFRFRDYGEDRLVRLDPRSFPAPLLAARLADKWLEVAKETPGSQKDVDIAVRNFIRHISGQLRVAGDVSAFSLADVRRRHLDAWEMELLDRSRGSRSYAPYRHAIHLFALLRRIEADAPGSLHEELRLRLEGDTRLRFKRNPGVEAFTSQEVRRLRSAAHRLVYRALQTGPDGPTDRDTLLAVHVLLSLATAEPPEVLRQLTINSITATAAPEHDSATERMTHSARLTWLAEHDLVDRFAVTYVKNRAAGQEYQEIYTRRERSAHQGFTSLLRLTAAARRQADLEALWLYRRRDGCIAQPPWRSYTWKLGGWTSRHGVAVGGRVWFLRFRKVAIAREAAQQGGLYLRRGRRHTTEVFFNHYTQSTVLRARAGRLLLDAVDEYFAAAIKGPLVVTSDAEKLLAQGEHVLGLDPDVASRLVQGELDGPHTACRDPLDSPYGRPGEVCSRSMTGTCFGCRNALITQAHLPAALLVAELSDPARSADPAKWNRHWKDIHTIITTVVLPAFPAVVVQAARERMGLVPLDPGTANDMRGPHGQ
jgi:hypothetical protein